MNYETLTDDQEQAREESFNALQAVWDLANLTLAEIFEAGFLAGVRTSGEQNE